MFGLIPKEMEFYTLFNQSAKLLLDAGKLLHELMIDFRDLPAKAQRMERLEHDADQVTHEIISRLNKTFITPLDREDIHELATTLDDVMDFIEGVTEHLILYRVEQPTPQFQAMAEVVAMQVEEINKMIPRLKDLRHADILQHCIEINRLENQADRLLREAVVELFDRGGDPLKIMKWRELYALLETATDKCEDVAVVIEGIFLKNG